MAAKNAHEAARAKAAKQKKLLALLVVPLAGAGFFAYHTLTKLNSPQSASAPPPAAAAPAATVSTGTPVSATTPASTTPMATVPSDAGKLDGLSRLPAKDPFFDQGPRVGTTSSGSGSQSNKGNAKKHAKKPVPPPTAAVISVNGVLASVPLGAAFPVTKNVATDGIFRLVALTANTAKIAVAGGSYANGRQTLTLTVDSAVTLVNTADGKRYTLVLLPQGTPAPGAAATTATTTTTGP